MVNAMDKILCQLFAETYSVRPPAKTCTPTFKNTIVGRRYFTYINRNIFHISPLINKTTEGTIVPSVKKDLVCIIAKFKSLEVNINCFGWYCAADNVYPHFLINTKEMNSRTKKYNVCTF